MRIITIFLLLSNFTFSQKKKEQIQILSERIDSINNANFLTVNTLKDSIKLLQYEKDILNRSGSKLNLELKQSMNRESNLQVSLDSLSEIMKKGKVLTLETRNKFVGTYEFEYGDGNEEDEFDRIGSLQLFSKNDGIYFFSIEYNIGAPSYNMGSIIGSFKVFNNIGVFYANVNAEYEPDIDDSEIEYCKIVFIFDENGVYVHQYSSDIGCGFGGNVSVNDYFYKTNSNNEIFDISERIPSLDKW
ncbi:MAG: hypothetical protein RL308_3250 [Bacteroidota bacterium]|jgi:hypothetical protein